ncbi:TPM domain-containing protein [Sphingosinicella sp.]|uniref:TPM domain-containing protein n=1 Tax=Sphingosinicella sp. TaxID=1917971 RepID=UPI0040378D57
MVTRLTEADHEKVTDAVRAAEAKSSGEIVTIVAARSDFYHDVGLHYAVLAMLLVPALGAVVPQGWIDWGLGLFLGWNAELSFRTLMVLMFVKMALFFLIVRYALAYMPLRMALTPRRTKARRVHRRAVEVFRTGCELKTRGRTGVLIYLSIAEHRAEIVADQAITEKVPADVWVAALAALIDEVKAGRPGDGLAKAVGQVGDVLAPILPPIPHDENELPDRLVEL